jgi:hypothetical protein
MTHEIRTVDDFYDAIGGAEVLLAAARADDCRGFCLRCGDEAYGVEPDARRYRCESCGESAVYGAEEIIIRIG